MQSTKKLIDLIAGARPNFMKIAPIIKALEKDGAFDYRLIHTGQHYDRSMSGSFFEELDIPDPDLNLQVGSGTQAEQTGGIMLGYEKVLFDRKSDLCVVVGDVTSTMACAITAQKMRVAVAHVEGGIRSGDWTMPEEINRLATDAVTNYFFTTSVYANENLRKAGVESDRIFFVGNTMIDTLLQQMPRLRKPAVFDQAGLEVGKFIVMTLHRPANVDEPAKLKEFLDAILANTENDKIIWPVHPRTRKVFERLSSDYGERLICVAPMGYLEFNWLVKNARGVITDSGGITEETTVMHVPCMTLRDNTERPETIEVGTNELVGADPAKLGGFLKRLYAGEWKVGRIPELWDGQTAERIVRCLHGVLYPGRGCKDECKTF
jgi:UDP-N-acetylglucosamine 2-epimerase (non-hydrolysing)